MTFLPPPNLLFFPKFFDENRPTTFSFSNRTESEEISTKSSISLVFPLLNSTFVSFRRTKQIRSSSRCFNPTKSLQRPVNIRRTNRKKNCSSIFHRLFIFRSSKFKPEKKTTKFISANAPNFIVSIRRAKKWKSAALDRWKSSKIGKADFFEFWCVENKFTKFAPIIWFRRKSNWKSTKTNRTLCFGRPSTFLMETERHNFSVSDFEIRNTPNASNEFFNKLNRRTERNLSNKTKVRSFSSSKHQNFLFPLDDLIFLEEIRPTDEQIQRARRLQLPDSFFLYENRPPCPGCLGCEDQTHSQSQTPRKTSFSFLSTVFIRSNNSNYLRRFANHRKSTDIQKTDRRFRAENFTQKRIEQSLRGKTISMIMTMIERGRSLDSVQRTIDRTLEMILMKTWNL